MPHLSSLFNVTKCKNIRNIMRIAAWFSWNHTKWNFINFSNNVKNCLEQINVTFNIYCFWLFEKIGRLWSLLLLICFGIFYYYFSVLFPYEWFLVQNLFFFSAWKNRQHTFEHFAFYVFILFIFVWNGVWCRYNHSFYLPFKLSQE